MGGGQGLNGPDRAGRWFEPVADFLGPAYLRYSFTRGTEQEVGFLFEALGLAPGQRLLDVGCGPGRHAHAFAHRGLRVTGVDISERFLTVARDGGAEATFARADARLLPLAHASVDVAISLCQGGFGLVGPDDDRVLHEIAGALRPGGRLALSAFSSYFAVRHLEPDDRFDAATGVHRESMTVRNDEGAEASFEVGTTCFTPRELRLMCEGAGFAVDGLWSVTPGEYGRRPPAIDRPEYLVVGTRAGGSI